jgi:hypothetical protein
MIFCNLHGTFCTSFSRTQYSHTVTLTSSYLLTYLLTYLLRHTSIYIIVVYGLLLLTDVTILCMYKGDNDNGTINFAHMYTLYTQTFK